MPCHDPRNEPSYVAEEVRRDCRHNSDVAELLCYILTNYQSVRNVAAVHQPLAQWWSEHQERDRRKAKAAREREEREQASIREQIAILQKKLKK